MSDQATPLVGTDRFVSEAECKQLSALSRTTRWRLERQGLFPARRRIAPNRVGWRLSEVLAWLESREAIA